MIGTFMLVFAALYIAAPDATLGSLKALPVALVVLGIGLSLGGPTGYAINPARDLGPRIMHAVLPIPGKETVTGHIAGYLLLALLLAVCWRAWCLNY